MSSYYRKVDGNLQPAQTARVDDINLIQTNIQQAIQKLTQDCLGPNFIIGEEEEALQLVPTTDVIDQSNYNYEGEGTSEKNWITFYDIYLRQNIHITKSSIESITVQMRNTTKISVTIYAEIRNKNLELIAQSSAVLDPLNSAEKDYTPITFNFNADHLSVGDYYFIIRPVDISTTDLTDNGDELLTAEETISESDFQIRYDFNGTYTKSFNDITYDEDENEITVESEEQGLEVSPDGENYYKATILKEALLSTEDIQELESNAVFDLYFEEAYSSGLTYTMKYAEAIVAGEKVDSCDTHIKINEPSTLGNRTDLVVLKPNGQLNVIQGSVYTSDEKEYPNCTDGLKIAYITTYKNGEKVATIEQDDENGMTRRRDILERIRRLEKKLNYQIENNSPSRIKYNSEVDPIVFKDGLSSGAWDKESTNGFGLNTNDKGQNVATTDDTLTYIWSIIKGTYSYSYDQTTKVSAYCRVFNVDAPVDSNSLPKNTEYKVFKGIYIVKLSTKRITNTHPDYRLQYGIKGETLKVEIKSGKQLKYKKSVMTNKYGEGQLDLTKAKLKKGKYTVYSTINSQTIKTKLTVHDSDYTVKSAESTMKAVTLKDTIKLSGKDDIKNQGIIYGNDAFETSNVTVNTDDGIIELTKNTKATGKYIKNTPLSTDRSKKPYFKSDIHEYHIYSDKENLMSEFPVLHLNFDRDTHIKSIKPYIKKFKNIKSFGVLLFKNDQVINIKNHKRKVIEKSFKKDKVYPTIFQASKNIKKPTKDSKGVQKLDSYVTFDCDIKLKAGTYTLAIFAKLINGKKEGSLYLREFETLGNLEKYGMSAKSTGSSNLSVLRMSTNNLTDRSWNVVFKQKPTVYQSKGTIMSAPKDTERSVKTCHIQKNIKIPDGCSIRLEVSNNGGNSWVDATTATKVTFNGTSNVFRWKLTMYSNNAYSPQLYYNKNKKYAIKFTLGTIAPQSTPYEDIQRCYETPLFNANSITRTFVANQQVKDKFSEWEFARLFMVDESEQSNVDICISYDYDNYSTAIDTFKDNWGPNIFFSQIFADLQLSDFSTDSVDYDNYDANVEFDEHNYRFKMKTEEVMHNNSGINVASLSAANADYRYGNINGDEITNKIKGLFKYTDVYERNKTDEEGHLIDKDGNVVESADEADKENIPYQYEMQGDNEQTKYNGPILTEGPYCLATFHPDENSTQYNSLDEYYEIDENFTKYIINGITFDNALRLDESKSRITVEIFPVSGGSSVDSEQFPGDTFELVVALTNDGSLTDDNSAGIAYPITGPLVFNEYNKITVDLAANIEQYAESGIRSIGLRVKNPANIKKDDGIGIGIVNVSTYNRRPYVPYTYTGSWDRFKWTPLKDDACVYNIIKAKVSDSLGWLEYFYPTSKDDQNAVRKSITYSSDAEAEDAFNYASKYKGTAVTLKTDVVDHPTYSRKVTDISRQRNKVKAKVNNINVTTTAQGDNVLLRFPAGKSGDIFKIDLSTPIPLYIYDLIDIEYYVYHSRYKTAEAPNRKVTNIFPVYKLADEDDTYKYHYHGNFSKGDIKIKFYATKDITNEEPIETFTLPSWGRIQQNATVDNKTVHAWFKKRSDAASVQSIVIERNDVNGSGIQELDLVLNNILLFNADTMPALGPQMLMRIYPKKDLDDIQIRKSGCIYRL